MSPEDRHAHPAAFVGLGLSAVVGLHALFILGWDGFFSRSSWPGYEYSMQAGMVEPWFVNTPRSLWLTRVVLFALAFVVIVPIRHGRLARTSALWLGAAAATAILWFTTMSRTFEGGAAGFIFYPIRIGLPILAGSLAAGVLHRLSRVASRESPTA